MDSSVVAALVSGICSIVSAFGAVYLKEYLDSRKASPEKPSRPLTQAAEPATTAERPSTNTVVRRTHVRVPIRRPIVIVFASFLFGVITRALRPYMEIGNVQYESLIALVVLIGLVGVLAVFHRRKGFQVAFQLENLALWSGWASGWSLVHGGVWGDLLAVTIPWWLGCSVVGGVVVSFHRTRDA